jgi:hypothetical protein
MPRHAWLWSPPIVPTLVKLFPWPPDAGAEKTEFRSNIAASAATRNATDTVQDCGAAR